MPLKGGQNAIFKVKSESGQNSINVILIWDQKVKVKLKRGHKIHDFHSNELVKSVVLNFV